MHEARTLNASSCPSSSCTCVCVCVWERERERERETHVHSNHCRKANEEVLQSTREIRVPETDQEVVRYHQDDSGPIVHIGSRK